MVADAEDVQAFMLRLGVALTMTGDAVSEIQAHLRAVATSYGYKRAHISVLPTLIMVALRDGDPVAVRTIDSFRQLRLDQSSEVIRVARSAEAGEIAPSDALGDLHRALRMEPRFGPVWFIASHALLTLGLGLVIGPASGDFWWYLLLGALVGALKLWSERFGAGGSLVALVAGLLQLALLAIAIVVGAEIVGNSHAGPIAGSAARNWGSWQAWLGVAIFGLAIYVHNSAPKGALPWLLIVLFSAWAGQLIGKQVIDATLSGFVGAALMVPIAHVVARARTAPPAHVMFLPAFWLLVPGTIGLIGVTELVGNNSELGIQNLTATIVSIPSVALGILVGTMTVRGVRIARRQHLFSSPASR